jgi:3',5'-cyclic AMP phosphodiesterase CpdA
MTLIAQVSDLHIRAQRKLAYRKVDTAAALERCVAHLNALSPAPDAVLFTGDMGDLGLAEEYAIIAEILSGLRLPYWIVPGNHDRRQPLHDAFGQAAPLNKDGYMQYVLDHLPLRLIGLDSLDQGRPAGRLCEARLDWLEQALADDPQRPTLLFLHHPPFVTGIAHMDVQNLGVGAERLQALVSTAPGVCGVICGHLHRPIHTVWSAVAASCAPSPAHQVCLDLSADGAPAFVMEPPGVHLHRWTEAGGLVTHLSVIGDFGAPAPFFDAFGALIQ